ncbi:MAG: prolyl oligopeptidase family serine peptidase [bacterium]|nr:prolyl oligopeptidase family serine peptidase [bacterium]
MKTQTTLLLFLIIPFALFAQTNEYPKAEKIPFKTYIHKDTLTDNYYWLRDKNSAETINYLYANNAHANNALKSSNLLQKVLFEEFKNIRKENYDTRPTKIKDYYYFSRVDQDKEYPDLYRKKDSLSAKEQLVLSLNNLSKEYAYFNLGIGEYSPNQSLLAYGIDGKGNNVHKLFIKQIDADSIYAQETLEGVLSVLWCKDNYSFYYTVPEPKTLRSHKVFKHILGTKHSEDQLIFEEPDKTYQIGLSRSASKELILMNITKTRSNEMWFWPDSSWVKPELFLKRTDGLIYGINHFEGNDFYVFTNLNAKNNQLMTAPLTAKSTSNWKPLILTQEQVLLTDYSLLKDYLILSLVKDVESKIVFMNRKTNEIDSLNIGLPCGSVSYSFDEYDYHKSKSIRFSVQNFITPAATYDYNIYNKEKNLIELDTLNIKYNPHDYETKRLYAKSADGVMVPMTIYYKKGLVLNGKNPLLLEGYGSYGGSSFPTFRSFDINYLKRGFILATAHIRGGKELGENWYENGKLMKKKNTFNDFIACAQYLIQEKYTSAQKLAIQGGSAGGLLMGSVLNMRPDLFKCAVANVPFVDVINTMLDESIPLTTFEFEEWGNPKNKAFYTYMKSYSPYDNVSVQAYPNILVTAGYNDAQVGYWEPAKWVSKLREFKTDTNLLLFKTNMDGGHGGASGKYEKYKEEAFTMAFIMASLGVKENYVVVKGKVLDENNEPMVYTSIFIDGTSTGTSSNINGEFEIQVKELDKSKALVGTA